MTNEQRQAILTDFYASHPEMRTERAYREYLANRYPPLPATDADLPKNKT
jgi:hypothetical protein